MDIHKKKNIRIETLLELLEELVEEKMWKRIINMERSNSNNYQHKVTIEAHKKAEIQFVGKVECLEIGTSEDIIYMDEFSQTKDCHQNDVIQIQEEQNKNHRPLNFEKKREIALQDMCNFARTLQEEEFDGFMKIYKKYKHEIERDNGIVKKRKVEK